MNAQKKKIKTLIQIVLVKEQSAQLKSSFKCLNKSVLYIIAFIYCTLPCAIDLIIAFRSFTILNNSLDCHSFNDMRKLANLITVDQAEYFALMGRIVSLKLWFQMNIFPN